MFASSGQIVGLIEIETQDSDSIGLVPGLESDAEAASLGELFAMLAGRLAARGVLAATIDELPNRPTNRLKPSPGGLSAAAPTLALRVDADLSQLAADLADQTARIRLRLLEAVADEPTC
jgi:hypothetical protein